MLVCCEEESDNCKPESTRCLIDEDQEIVQVCNTDQIWEDALNCTEIEWICCLIENDFVCLPEDECNR